MKLRHAVLLSAVIVTCFLTLLTLYISRGVILENYARIEQQHVEGDLDRTVRLFSAEANKLNELAQDYAQWDDTYGHMWNPDARYVRSNYAPTTLHNLDLRLALLLDYRDHPILKKCKNSCEGVSTEDINAVLIANHHAPARSVGKSAAGILLLPSRPVFVSFQPILTSAAQGQPRGTLVMARDLDAQVLARISDLAQLPVEVLPKTAPLQVLSTGSSQGQALVQVIDDDHIAGVADLKDLYGQPIVRLRILHNREIFRQGQWVIRFLLLVIVLLGAMVALLNVWIVRRAIVNRIETLTGFIHNIGLEQDLHRRIHVRGMDEIAELGAQMNGMLQQLQESRQQLLVAREHLEFEATHDGLTGVWNHVTGLNLLDRELDRCAREHEPVGVIMIDADHFKSINDTYGHAVGDKVLQNLAAIVLKNLRSFDVLARYGGEEFLIVAPGCAIESAAQIADRVLNRIREMEIVVGETLVRVTASAGVTAGKPPYTSEDLIAIADRALYSAKNKGRNCVVTEEPPETVDVKASLYAFRQFA